MHGLHENQQKILAFLLERPSGATLEEIASHLGITKSAAKEHLIKVDGLGFIAFTDTRGTIGRPKRKYFLSQEGHDAFPKQYSWLSSVLLELLAEDLGKEAVSRLMTDLADKVSNSMLDRFDSKHSSSELIEEISKVLNELGYRVRLKQRDVRKGAVLEASNCVYHSVAKRHPELCRFDVRFIENASKMDVKLESCIARGGDVCRFCLKKRGS